MKGHTGGMRVLSISLEFLKQGYKKHPLPAIFLICLLIYNINLRPISSGDTVPATLLPFNLLETHSFYMDSFVQGYSDFYGSGRTPGFFAETGNHYLSMYPVVTPVLITPLYLIPYAILKLMSVPIDVYNPVFLTFVKVMEKASASIIASLSVVFTYLALKQMSNEKVSLIACMIFALATNTWVIGSQALWQHGMIELMLSTMIFIVLLDAKDPKYINMVYLGILSGFFLFCRPPDAVFILPLALYVISLKDWKKLALYCIPAALAALPFAAYNVHYFHSIFGGYNSLVSLMDLNHNVPAAAIGLLFSPNRGIFIYSPILLFSIAGIFLLLMDKNQQDNIKRILLAYAACLLLGVLIYSTFSIWWGGHCYGYRFLTGSLPVYAMFLGISIDRISRMGKARAKAALCTIFLALTLLSILIQIIGAFYYPNNNWDAISEVDQDRVWDYNDTQIMRSFNAGPIIITPTKLIALLDMDKSALTASNLTQLLYS